MLRTRPSRCSFSFWLLAVLALAASVPPGWAGVGIWTPLGPEGAHVTALAVDPFDADVIYAGTYRSGVFKSADGGATWAASGLPDTLSISAFAFDVRHPGTVYARVLRTGTYKSTNSGLTWSRTSAAGIPEDSPDLLPALEIDSRTGVLYTTSDAGVYRSADGGVTWKPRARVLGSVRALAIDAAGTLYAGTGSGGVWKSGDQGASWQASHQGLPAGVPVLALAVDPERPRSLLAGTAQGLYRSTNGGGSWQPAGVPAQAVIRVAFQRGGRAYAGYETTPSLLRSADGGATWRRTGPWDGGRVSALAATPDRVFAGLSDTDNLFPERPSGLFRSLDAGVRWERSESGLHGLLYMTSVAVDPADPRVIYASTLEDLWKSTDGGATWRRLDLGPPSTTPRWINDILIDPARPATIWLSLYGPLLRSDDAGATWRALTPLPEPSRSDLALDPRAPQALWRTGREGVYHSTDGGLTWQLRLIEPSSPLSRSELYDVKVDPRDPEVIYAAGSRIEGTSPETPRIYRSTDGGQTWQRRDQGIPSVTVRVNELAFDPVHPDTLYAATTYGLYRSTDNSLSWQAVTSSRGGGDVVAAPGGPGTPPAVYTVLGGYSTTFSFFYSVILRSTDGGATWTQIGRGLRGFSPSVLAVDPHDPAHILTGTVNGGLFSYTVPH